MENTTTFFEKALEKIKQQQKEPKPIDLNHIEIEQQRIDRLNSSMGNLPGNKCDLCYNKGYIYYLKGENQFVKDCECMKGRKALKNIEKSGLKEAIETMTFDTYIVKSDWQKTIKENAAEFASDPKGWFFIGGSVGSGKTHICTGLCRELLMYNREVKYITWVNESKRLKSMINDNSYDEEINKLVQTEILYIDDFLKTANKQKPTQGDLNLAIDIIFSRYQKNRNTIISCEWSVQELIEIDEAMGSRIKEKSNSFNFTLTGNKNMRLTDR